MCTAVEERESWRPKREGGEGNSDTTASTEPAGYVKSFGLSINHIEFPPLPATVGSGLVLHTRGSALVLVSLPYAACSAHVIRVTV